MAEKMNSSKHVTSNGVWLFYAMSIVKRLEETTKRIIVKRLIKKRRFIIPADDALAVNLVSSWDKKCGIATYSAFLAEELRKRSKVYVTVLPDKPALNPYFLMLGYKVGRSQDLVHVQFEYGIFPGLKIGKKTLTAFASLLFYTGLSLGNRRGITTMHEPRKTATAGSKGGLFFTKLLDKVIFGVSDLIIAHTFESKELLEKLGVPPAKLCVIPHGSFEKRKFLEKNECKRKLGLEGKTVMTILGFVTPKKGHDLVIPLLQQIDANVQLVVAGGPQTDADAEFLEKLKGLVEQYHCSDRVTFTGYLPDLSLILNATDLAVLPYRSVTDSGVLHLLVSYRVPTIASDLKAFKEVYQEYACLQLFRSEDQEDLLAKIQSLLSNQDIKRTLEAKCEDMWNATKWSTIAQRHIEVYREVLNLKKAP
jgi:glycosyltransferase involved in cell wall biosynthesis